MIFVDTRRALRKLTVRMLQADKIRNIVATAAITVAFILFTIVFAIIRDGFLNSYTYLESNLSNAHGVLYYPEASQKDALAEMEFIKRSGARTFAARGAGELESLWLYYSEPEEFAMLDDAFGIFAGTYPQAAEEVLLPYDLLIDMGIHRPEVGMEIAAAIVLGEEGRGIDFRLSGWYVDNLPAVHHAVGFVAEEFLTAYPADDRYELLFFQVDRTEKLDLYMEQITELAAVSEEQQLRRNYSSARNNRDELLWGTAAGMAAIMLFGYLVIHNVFYISVARDIRYYGLLKTIGASKRQLKKILVRQSAYLTVAGITLGAILLLLAELLMFGVSPAKSGVFTLRTALPAGILVCLMVRISVYRSWKKAAAVVPVEAIAYMMDTQASYRKKNLRSSSAGYIAFRNVFRSPRRMVVMMATMLAGPVLLLILTAFFRGVRVEQYSGNLVEGDMLIYSDAVVTEDGIEWDYVSQLDDVFLRKLTDIDGVTYIYPASETIYEIPETPELDSYYDYVYGYLEEFKPEDTGGVVSGGIVGIPVEALEELYQDVFTDDELRAFEQGELLILDEEYRPFFEWPEEFEMYFAEGTDARQFRLKYGNIAIRSGFGRDIGFVASDQLIAEVDGTSEPSQLIVGIDEEREEEAIAAVHQLVDDYSGLSADSRHEVQQSMGAMWRNNALIGLAGAGLFFLLGMMHYMNVAVTGLYSRIGELSILEGVGMTKRQIRKMLALEGAIISAVVMCVSTIFVCLIYYTAVKYMEYHLGYLHTRYPAAATLLVAAAQTAICMLVPVLTYHQLSRNSISDRVRSMQQ